MKKKGIKNIILVGMFISVLLFLPVLANANAVPWSSEQYMVDAWRRSFTSPVYGPPLPISDSYTSAGLPHDTANSSSTYTTMNVSSRSFSTDYTLQAVASFSGTYSATAADPLFQFIYDGTYTSVNPVCYGTCSERYAWLIVTDLTTSTTLYDNQSLTLDGNQYAIGVSTQSGHNISVDFGGYVRSTTDGAATNNENVTLNYSTAVAPEPISSVLFVMGGTLLAGRRFLRRKA